MRKKRNNPKQRKRRPARPQARDRAWSTRRIGAVEVLKAKPLDACGWLVHGFSTRGGGKSRLGEDRVLNLGYTKWDSHGAVEANRKRFLTALGAEEMTLVTLRQIHSDVIHEVTAATHHTLRGDALITRAPGPLLAVQTADCVPILLSDLKHDAVAAVHAGWRGTVKRIAAKTLGRMQMLYGTRPADVLAALPFSLSRPGRAGFAGSSRIPLY